MATVEVTKDNFQDVVTASGTVIIDFWAPWCGPCKSFGPVYEQVSEQFPDVVFAKVNTEQEQELAGHFQIRSIPTLMVFRDNVILYSEPGALSPTHLAGLVGEVQALDMAEVHKEIAKQQDGEA
jgi:thioredoxin 1